LLGNNGLVKFDDSVDLRSDFDRWLQKGFPHHVCVAAGRHGVTLAGMGEQCGVTVLRVATL
jgi:hypothetical protein